MRGRALFLCMFFVIGSVAGAWTEKGVASWYGGIFQGRKTANGEIYDTYGHTCAHKTLPFGTMLKVTNLGNNKSTVVRVNDRGPFVEGRIIDLTYSAAKEIGMIADGTAKVRLDVVGDGIPELRFVVQVGAWRDFDNVRKHRRVLTNAGFKIQAKLGNDGITRIFIDDLSEDSVFAVSQKLAKAGYSDLFIYQKR